MYRDEPTIKDLISGAVIGAVVGLATMTMCCLMMPADSSELDYSWGTGTGIMHEAHIEKQKAVKAPQPVSVVLNALLIRIEIAEEKISDIQREVRRLRKAAKEKHEPKSLSNIHGAIE